MNLVIAVVINYTKLTIYTATLLHGHCQNHILYNFQLQYNSSANNKQLLTTSKLFRSCIILYWMLNQDMTYLHLC